jgi:uncharacterized membrane protein YoaK (UPF0700 family)
LLAIETSQKHRQGAPATGEVDLALLLLGLATGASDAFSFLTGGVFASVMTGNLVLLGLSASNREGTLALHAGLSLGGYVGGVLVGVRICRPPSAPDWPPGCRAVLGIELALLVGVAVARGTIGGPVSSPVELSLLFGTAAAMGLQSAVGRAAPLVKRSTTYLTGALTEVVASLATGRGLARERQTLLVLGAAAVGAGAEAALVLFVPRVGPLLAVLAVGCVLLVVNAAHRTLTSR